MSKSTTPIALKKKILEAGFSGKLVPQIAGEGTANELLHLIEKEKNIDSKNRRSNKWKSDSNITEDKIPFEIPKNWKWVKLGSVCKFIDGELKTNLSLPYLEAKVCRGEIKPNYHNSGEYVQKDTYVILVDGENSGELFVVPYDGYLCSTFKILQISLTLDVSYIRHFIDLHKDILKSSKTGSATPHLNKKLFANLLLPLPPLLEQKRIIEKIEKLIVEVDNIEQNLVAYTANQDALIQKVLNDAIRGKLVPQIASEGTANELLHLIEKEKNTDSKNRYSNKWKSDSNITEDEIPFEIPKNWKWVRLGDIVYVGTGKTPATSNREYYDSGTIPWVTSSYTNREIIQSVDSYITEKAIDEYKLVIYPKGTLVIALYGDGKTRAQISELGIPAAVNQAIASLCEIYKSPILKKYIKYYCQKNYERIRNNASGTSQDNLNLGKISSMLIPLPPLAEQKRIVEKLDELMSLIHNKQK